MSRSTLLSLLADGEFRSGEDLAKVLGVSRTAVWKRLKRVAEDSGLEIESTRGRGYRIPGGLTLLDQAAITAAMNERSLALMSELDIHDSIDSTNAEILRRNEAACLPGLVCTAEQQTAGRGRRGRAWISPYASNLYLSVLWKFDQGAAALEGLSLAVGVAVARALATCDVSGVELKWPNDVMRNGAKLGGILLEMQGDAAGACRVVIGVGLNVVMPAAAAQGIDQAWTDLMAATGKRPDRNRLLAALLNELLPMVADFETQGFAPWREQWLSLDAFADAPVTLQSGDSQLGGIARGVDQRGALLLETGTGIQTVYGGEISLRAAS